MDMRFAMLATCALRRPERDTAENGFVQRATRDVLGFPQIRVVISTATQFSDSTQLSSLFERAAATNAGSEYGGIPMLN
jgi:hypothetical protein